jgi:hypothetical protein
LSGEIYPEAATEVPPPGQFDEWVLGLFGDEEGAGSSKLKSVIKDWSDAVRHFDSVLAKSPGDAVATRNRDLTKAFLKRIEELLKQEQQQAQQAMPQEQQGDGQPRQSEGEPNEDGEEGQEGEPKTPGKQGDKAGPPEDPGAGGEEHENQSPPGPKPAEGSEEPKDDGEEGETPEERARRRLKENADVERGPLSPGRFELNDPDKDW